MKVFNIHEKCTKFQNWHIYIHIQSPISCKVIGIRYAKARYKIQNYYKVQNWQINFGKLFFWKKTNERQ